MATVKEMVMQDAAASIETSYMMAAGDTFDGTITNTAGDREDWIGIEMEAGTTYTISVSGILSSDNGGEMDTILTLYDDKGGVIDMSDDTMEGLGSELDFTPEVDATYYISVSTYRNNPNLDNSGSYTVSVTGVVVDPAVGMDINGTERVMIGEGTPPATEYSSGNDKLKGTDAAENINGLSGDDSLYGMGGNDTLDGGADDDLLMGGPGADTLKGGAGVDVISYSSSPMGVTVNLTTGTARGGDADGDTIVDMGTDEIEGVRGSMYDDSLTGSSAANQLWGLGGNDELDGLRRDDELYGGAGDDDLDGGDGDDILEGGYGADMLTGGDHADMGDTASYSMSMMGVTVRLHSGQAMGGDAEGDVFAGSGTPVEYTDSDEEMAEAAVVDIENLTGSAMADILAGDLRDNTIKGGGGDDKIYGGPNPADADKESDAGLTNADMLMGQGGNDMLFGGVGADTLMGGNGNDTLNGGPGIDTFRGGAGSDVIHADADDVDINGYDAVEDDTATTEDERLDDVMDIDTVSYAKLEDGVTRQLNTNATEIASPTAAGGATILNVENIIGSQGIDTLTGSAEDNVIEGGEGGDTLAGGDGNDTLSYEGSDDWVRVTLRDDANSESNFIDASRGHASGDKVLTTQTFENITGSAFDDDLTGNSAVNVIKGLAGDDDIDGGGGNDTIEGGAGADKLDGDYTDSDNTNEGNQSNSQVNTLSYASSNAAVTVNLMTSSATGGHATGDTIVTYEELVPTVDDPQNKIDVATFRNVIGSMHDDSLTGNQHDNKLEGGAGDDTLRGGASDAGARDNALALRGDVLVGGPGADMLDGGEDMGEKNDMVPNPDFDDTSPVSDTNPEMVAASVDWAVYKEAMEGVTVDLSTNRGTGGEAMGDTLVNIELVWGSEKDDTFISGPGGDTIEGDGGSDTVSYEASSLGVTVDLSSATQHRTVAVGGTGTEADPFVFHADDGVDGRPLPEAVARPTVGVPAILQDDTAEEDEDDNPNTNGARGDRLGSIENLTGSAMKDSLIGDTNPNVLKGMGGNDTLVGGAGNDKLYGGDGDDTLSASDGANTLDGGAGDDTITGGTANDTINGGAGDDQMDGGTGGQDTFVFGPDDGEADDVITGLTSLANDAIDLSAYDLDQETLIGLIDVFGGNVRIDLTSVGGGKIILDGVTTLNGVGTVDDNGTTGDTSDDTLTALTMFGDTDGNGVFDAGEGGFILG